jgi:hypothetical protein
MSGVPPVGMTGEAVGIGTGVETASTESLSEDLTYLNSIETSEVGNNVPRSARK